MSCPRCATAVSTTRGAEPWCARCEWNLAAFEPSRRHPEIGWRWADRATHRIAWRLTESQFRTLADGPLARRTFTTTRAAITAIAVMMLLFVVATAAAGIWLIAYDFPRLTILPGVTLLAIAVALRPRFHTLDDEAHPLTAEQAPELHALIARVAAAIEAPMPHIVAVDRSTGAYTTAVGIRRRRALVLGIPLWAALDPQERVALIGHELGHFVNGDVRRLPLEGVALTTLDQLAVLTRPGSAWRPGPVEMLVGIFQWVVFRLVVALHLIVVWTGQRDRQRAEYLADDLASRAAGTRAAVRMLDLLLVTDALDTVIRREARARRAGPAWREAADTVRTNLAASMPLLRQLSRREEVSLFASHPPTGLRVAMLEQRPARAAEVTLTESQSARIDEEIVEPMEHVRRDLAHA
ncbi:M48 family metallopeptidase [Actinoplanes sp. NPDC051346]|uniref:M48 family metallopeptidase n=1 Tax=Actinoplanes sp. NPDC051346 TaxID=3155048 RepID=UPI003435A51C